MMSPCTNIGLNDRKRGQRPNKLWNTFKTVTREVCARIYAHFFPRTSSQPLLNMQTLSYIHHSTFSRIIDS